METQKIKSQELFFIQRLLVVSLIISGVLTYFVACNSGSGNSGRGAFGSGDVPNTDFFAKASLQVNDPAALKGFLGEATSCCSNTRGATSCGTANTINAFNNLWNGAIYGDCGFQGGQQRQQQHNPYLYDPYNQNGRRTDVGNRVFDGVRCLQQVESSWSKSRCDSFTDQIDVELFYNDRKNGPAIAYVYVFDNREGVEVGVIAYTGQLRVVTTADSARWEFNANGGAFYGYVFDGNGNPFVNEDRPKRIGARFSLAGSGKILKPGAFDVRVRGVNGFSDSRSSRKNLFDGHMNVERNRGGSSIGFGY